jgi:hypothetical protein
MYCEFGVFEKIQTIGGDLSDYRTSLTIDGQTALDKELKLADEIRKNFNSDQLEQVRKRQRVTWNGKSIRQTAFAVDIEAEQHDDWYGIMCMISHGNPAMTHKSITLQLPGILLGQEDGGRKDGAEWLDRSSTFLYLASITLLYQQKIDTTPEDDAIIEKFKEVGRLRRTRNLPSA